MLSKGWLEEGSRHLDGDFPCVRDALPPLFRSLHSCLTQRHPLNHGAVDRDHFTLPPPPNPLFLSICSCCSAKQTKRRASRHVTFPGWQQHVLTTFETGPNCENHRRGGFHKTGRQLSMRMCPNPSLAATWQPGRITDHQ